MALQRARRPRRWWLPAGAGLVLAAGTASALVLALTGPTRAHQVSDPDAPIVSGTLAGALTRVWRDCVGQYAACGERVAGPADLLSFCNRLLPAGAGLPPSEPADMQPNPALQLLAHDNVSGPSVQAGGLTVECTGGPATDGWSVQLELPSRRQPLTGTAGCDASCIPTPAGQAWVTTDPGVTMWGLNGPRASLVVWLEGASAAAGSLLFDTLVHGLGLPPVESYLSANGSASAGDAATGGAPADSTASGAASPATAPPTGPHPGAPRALTGNDGKTYTLDITAQDRVTDCAAHAYGAVAAYLRTHPCLSAGRLIAIVAVNGRTAALSVIAVTMRGTPGEGYSTGYAEAGHLAQLEMANNTGSMNDMLREGARLPGVRGGIPAHEAFYVSAQDAGVTIMDAWWVHGTTRDQDPALHAAEHALDLTAATPYYS